MLSIRRLGLLRWIFFLLFWQNQSLKLKEGRGFLFLFKRFRAFKTDTESITWNLSYLSVTCPLHCSQLQSSVLLMQLTTKWTPIFVPRTDFLLGAGIVFFFFFWNLIYMGFSIVFDMTILNEYTFLVILRPGTSFWVLQVNFFLLFEISFPWVFQWNVTQSYLMNTPFWLFSGGADCW